MTALVLALALQTPAAPSAPSPPPTAPPATDVESLRPPTHDAPPAAAQPPPAATTPPTAATQPLPAATTPPTAQPPAAAAPAPTAGHAPLDAPPPLPYAAAPLPAPSCPSPPVVVVLNPLPLPPPPPPPRLRRFVFAAMPGLIFGVNAQMIPSATAAFFFGGRLRGGKWALGYQLTGTVGFADRYFLGGLTHRHHLTALTNFGQRGFASIGGGLAFLLFYPGVVEVETRIGMRFGRRKRGVFGAQVRLGHNFYYREKAPLPQAGLFLGFSLL